MALALRALLELLRIIRIVRNCIRRFPDRGASLLAFLGRKLKLLNTWWRFRLEIFGRPKPAERRFLGTEASSYSAVAGEYVVAASYVPPSASHPSLHEHTERQPATVAQAAQTGSVHPPVLGTLSVNHPYVSNPPGGHPHLPDPLGGRSGLGNRSTGNLSAVSIRSRASDRYSIITNSRESIRSTHGQPSSRHPRATHHQFGRGPDPARVPSRSRERPTRPSTPATRPHTPIHSIHPPRLEIITALPSSHGDGNASRVVQPSASSSYTHEPLSAPPTSETRGRRSSTIVVDIQNPSTDSLAMSPSANPPQITDEPSDMESSTIHSSPDSPAGDLLNEPSLGSPMSSNHPTLEDFSLPEGRFVQLINSDQIPRYTKNATIPRVETAYHVKPLTTEFPYFPEPNGFEQDSLQQDCSPWIPATHPDGGLYFYDEERVRVSVIMEIPSHDRCTIEEIVY
jgi:hypothetical protein